MHERGTPSGAPGWGSFLPCWKAEFANGDAHRLRVDLPRTSWGPFLVEFRFRAGRCRFRAESLELLCEFPDNFEELAFLESQFSGILDAMLSQLLVPDRAGDALFVDPARSGGIWLTAISRLGATAAALSVGRVPRATRIDLGYTFLRTGEQKREAQDLFYEFQRWLPDHFRIGGVGSARQRGVLAVKVHPTELWFLRYPLSLFCQFGFGEFAQYESVHWIATGRSLTETAVNRQQAEGEMSDTVTFLHGLVVVINTYQQHLSAGDGPLVKDATDLVLELLKLFRKVNYPPRTLSLRWFLNPSIEELRRTLLDTQTRFLYADFEASAGEWELGDSWRSPVQIQPDGKRPTAVIFDFAGLEGRLSHIRLMRVFHCNSVFDPGDHSGAQPADHTSIVGRLLSCGVQFVEGGMTVETYADFLCTLIELFFRRSDFRLILQMSDLEGQCDLAALVARANIVLTARFRESVAA